MKILRRVSIRIPTRIVINGNQILKQTMPTSDPRVSKEEEKIKEKIKRKVFRI